MSSVEWVEYVFAWHALSDACPKCISLNGREYRDQNLFQEVLWDPWYGNIWNLDAGHSLAHPNCRCQVEVRVITKPSTIQHELDLLLQTLRELRREIERRY